jgi:hypothetical protein
MNLARVDEALLQARQELIKDPRQGVEGLDTAPHIRHLAQLAIGSASEGFTPSGGGSGLSMAAVQKPPRFWTWGIPMRSLASGDGATEREQ